MISIYYNFYKNILRKDLIKKFNINNINQLPYGKYIDLYMNINNISKEGNNILFKSAFFLETFGGFRCLIKGFKFKFRFNSDNINFLLNLRISSLLFNDFLSKLIIHFKNNDRKIFSRKKIIYKNCCYIRTKSIVKFFNISLLEEDFFQWAMYLNLNIIYNNINKKHYLSVLYTNLL